eukprot:6198075-Pleurochrysis_carterae.AAC.2
MADGAPPKWRPARAALRRGALWRRQEPEQPWRATVFVRARQSAGLLCQGVVLGFRSKHQKIPLRKALQSLDKSNNSPWYTIAAGTY